MKLAGEDLACERGGRQVFAHVTFTAPAGALVELRGANGAGKTSLLRMIAGLVEPSAGKLVLEGGHSDLAIGQCCHLISHANAIKPALTVSENLTFWARFLGADGSRLPCALSALSLEALEHVPGALLSAGQRRRVALGRLIVVPRPIWLLDEPSVGLDDRSQSRLTAVMESHLGAGGLILAATHTGLGVVAADTVMLGGTDDAP